MHPRIFFFRRITVLTALAVYFFVVLCPTAVLRLVSGCECHLVYKYYVEDEANGIAERRERDVVLSEADKEALLGELVHSKWRASKTNSYHLHALVFHLPLGMRVTVLIQNFDANLQLHTFGSGCDMGSENAKRFWAILDRYTIDDFVLGIP